MRGTAAPPLGSTQHCKAALVNWHQHRCHTPDTERGNKMVYRALASYYTKPHQRIDLLHDPTICPVLKGGSVHLIATDPEPRSATLARGAQCFAMVVGIIIKRAEDSGRGYVDGRRQRSCAAREWTRLAGRRKIFGIHAASDNFRNENRRLEGKSESRSTRTTPSKL